MDTNNDNYSHSKMLRFCLAFSNTAIQWSVGADMYSLVGKLPENYDLNSLKKISQQDRT